GYVLFRFLPFFRFNVIMLFCIGFLESAFQKVLVLSFLYGKNLYKVLDKILKDFSDLFALSFIPNTLGLFAIYVLFYGIVGVILGILVGNYVLFLEKRNWENVNKSLKIELLEATDTQNEQRRKNKMYFSLLFLLFLLIFLYFSGEQASWWSVLLSIFAIIFWFSGALSIVFRYFLPKQSLQYQKEILNLLPQIRNIWNFSKKSVASISLPRKIFIFLHIFVVNVLFTQNDLPFWSKTDK
ncbi:MAG: hypothetical protein ACK40K_08245, partial [Raineya sp.]